MNSMQSPRKDSDTNICVCVCVCVISCNTNMQRDAAGNAVKLTLPKFYQTRAEHTHTAHIEHTNGAETWPVPVLFILTKTFNIFF